MTVLCGPCRAAATVTRWQGAILIGAVVFVLGAGFGVGTVLPAVLAHAPSRRTDYVTVPA